MLTTEYVHSLVAQALAEDVGSGDITAMLVDESASATARVITREPGVLCGSAFVNAVFAQLDETIAVNWDVEDGDVLKPGVQLFSVHGNARAILTGERTALNFLQTLSGTATTAQEFAQLVSGTSVRLLDTRKTIPGLRLAQKYAVRCGGCHNHRIGLYDAFLIKENHIEACGGIAEAIAVARTLSELPVEVEVENLAELDQALLAGADRIMLDNFSLADLREAVTVTAGRAELEASGNVGPHNLRSIAETGVGFISLGALTKQITPLDLSMRFVD